jgi:hypothetical protein
VEKLGVPPVGAAYVRVEATDDAWRPMPDGSVKMGPYDTVGEDKLSSVFELGAASADDLGIGKDAPDQPDEKVVE